MSNSPLSKAYIALFIILGAVLPAVIYFAPSFSIAAGLGAGILIVMVSISLSLLKTVRESALVSSLYDHERAREWSLAPKLLSEIAADNGQNKRLDLKIAELLKDKFQFANFAIFFREGQKYEPWVYSGISSRRLGSPKAFLLRQYFRGIKENGSVSTDERILRLLFKNHSDDDFEFSYSFVYQWDRSRSIILVAGKPADLMADALKSPDFNRTLWPFLDSQLRQGMYHEKIQSELKRQRNGYSQTKRENADLNKELNNRLLNLNSFVKISGDLYSIFNEDQLFATLKEVVKGQLGADKTGILHPTGEGHFALDDGDIQPELKLILDSESEFFSLLAKNPKPVLLPLAASGLKKDEPFISAALGNGYQAACSIRVGDKQGAVLLVGSKNDKTPYSQFALDSLSIITNIASLALENIRQYSTIEKLSYTDSMTGIYNYRYFYKRLSEEILRSKRYDRELSLVILDIDNFKIFNDNYGHQTGDLILKQISRLIMETIRSIDVVSRYGGEEFCIIMPDTGEDNCNIFIERLRNEIANFKFKSESVDVKTPVTVSVGGAIFPGHAETPDRIIYCADMALLKAKSMGRNKAIMFQPGLLEQEKSSIGRFDDNL